MSVSKIMQLHYLEMVKPFFKTAVIFKENIILIEPKNNIYFRIDNISTDLDFSIKMLEYVSRSTCKELNKYWQDWMARGFCSYFRQDWSHEDLMLIYNRLGNGVNRSLCIDFIGSDFDLKVIEDYDRGGQ